MPLLELPTLPKHMSSPPVFSGVCVTPSFVFCVLLSFFLWHCVVYSSIFWFWLPYLQTLLTDITVEDCCEFYLYRQMCCLKRRNFIRRKIEERLVDNLTTSTSRSTHLTHPSLDKSKSQLRLCIHKNVDCGLYIVD